MTPALDRMPDGRSRRGRWLGGSCSIEHWIEERTSPEPNLGCWLWLGGVSKEGYARGRLDGKGGFIHRLTYERLVGPIAPGLQLDHLCRVRCCINPRHLEPVTARINTLRGLTLPAANVLKTACPAGHPYDADNTWWRGRQRNCRACSAARARRRLAEIRADPERLAAFISTTNSRKAAKNAQQRMRRLLAKVEAARP